MSSPCATPVNFPAVISNRPSLPRIEYRIGRYSDFRARMLSLLDRSPLLSGWTHRQPDDPGIALVEGAAILGDILTFYQELYANEAWLRTAAWPESIAALVRLIGYRPAPGLGGKGCVAFEINGESPVTVPAGFPFKAQIEGMSAPANFETSESLVAIPALSRFSLYAPSEISGIQSGHAVFGASPADLASAAVTLKAGDRLMLVDDHNTANRQIAVVKSVATQLDQTVLTIAGGWQGAPPAGTMTAYKLGRTFRAFGYNAPATQFTLDTSHNLVSTPVDTTMSLDAMLRGFPLERKVDDLSAGITMLLDVAVTDSSKHASDWFKSMTALRVTSDTDSVGPLQGGITRVAFEPASTPISLGPTADRRTAICHEVIGAGFRISSVRQAIAGADTSELDFFGDGATYQELDGRLIQFVALNPDDTAARVEEATASIDQKLVGNPNTVALRRISLAPAPTEFTLADFPFSKPTIVVFGNVGTMTQGKTQPAAVLGNGDARQVYQSFRLPKAPLTWLADEALTPPRQPELQVLVNQIEWTEVDSLFASGPKDQVYILREDDSGDTWVQFGDGVNGATLPSGVNNITAEYRTGNGASGWRQSGAKPQALGRVANLGQVRLYDEVTGGTSDEDRSHVKTTAPSRVEELGRIVSLSDFEFEALAISGVEKALAVWDLDNAIPLLKVMVLLSDDSQAQLASVQASLSQANTDRGADRFPVLATAAHLEYVYLTLNFGLSPGYQAVNVIAAVTAALGVIPSDGSAPPSTGLFATAQRSLGQEEYPSRIEGTVQNVAGVAWAEVTALGSLGVAADPFTLSVPSPISLAATIACANDRVLALYGAHFNVTAGVA